MDQGCYSPEPPSNGSVRDSVRHGPTAAVSEGAPEEVDGVVHLAAGGTGEDLVAPGGGNLDPDARLEVSARRARPADRQRPAGPSLPGPEPLDGLRVVARQLPPE